MNLCLCHTCRLKFVWWIHNLDYLDEKLKNCPDPTLGKMDNSHTCIDHSWMQIMNYRSFGESDSYGAWKNLGRLWPQMRNCYLCDKNLEGNGKQV